MTAIRRTRVVLHLMCCCFYLPYRPIQQLLVGALEHFLFFHILGIIIPTDELIFFKMAKTTNQLYIYII